MKTNLLRTIITCCIITALISPGFCLPPITYLGIEQGLSNNSVRSIFQDHAGFMWFGTYDGLNRYDGYDFKVFRNDFGDTNSLVSNVVSVIAEDTHNNIWLGTRQGVSIYDHLSGKFTTVRAIDPQSGFPKRFNDVIKDIKRDVNGNMLVAAEVSGLLYCGTAARQVKQLPLLDNGKALISHYGVQSITVDKEGNTWVFVQGKGICRLDYHEMVLKIVEPAIRSANSITADGDSIWLCTEKGLFSFRAKRNLPNKILNADVAGLRPNFLFTARMDKEKNLWIGTNGEGLTIWNSTTKKISYIPQGDGRNELSSATVYAIYIDKESRKWIGTSRGGVNVIDPQKDRFNVVGHEPGNPNSLSGNFISALCETSAGNLWIGTEGSGLNYWDRNRNVYTHYKTDPDDPGTIPGNNITCIVNDHKSDIWIASFWQGLSRFNTATKKFERYRTINERNGTENKVAYAIYEDRNRSLWATTLRAGNIFGGLYKFNHIKDKFEMFDEELSDLFVLKEDNIGNLWGGNLDQLVRIDRANKKHSFYSIGQPVRSLAVGKSGDLWVGTEGGGLVRFDTKTNKITARYTTRQGLCNNAVVSILLDSSGNPWMGTFNGLSKFDISRGAFKNYYQTDGLQSNQFNYNTATILNSGAFVFGGTNGYSYFFPGNLDRQKPQSALLFTDIFIDGTGIGKSRTDITALDLGSTRELEVPYNKAVFSFGFTKLEYSSASDIGYAYYMEGWDKGWSNVGSARTATYTHLGEGKYTFRVKSTNSEGEWQPNEIAIHITVLPPWYRSWWAWVLYAVALATLVYAYILYRDRQARLRFEIELAHLATEKEREINERKLSFFTNISHEFRTPLTLIINPVKDILRHAITGREETDQNLGTVYRNARRLLSLVDQLLLFRKAESGVDRLTITKLDFYRLCEEVYLCFVQQARAKNIEYGFTFTNGSLEIYADREKMEIVLFNLVSNAMKYTPHDGKVSLCVTEGEGWVEVQVEDSGPGIPDDLKESIFTKFYQGNPKNTQKKAGFGIGLYLVKLFTGEHKGEIRYESKAGKGTLFSVRLQKGSSHFDASFISEEPAAEQAFLEELSPVEEPVELQPPNGKQPPEELVTDKQSLLVVDDEPVMRKYIAAIFTGHYIVYEGASGEEGMKLARQYQPDVIISDIKMEGLNGIELCRAIKTDHMLSHIPFILLTGTSSSELKLEGVEGGADDYITKPFERELLAARVSNLIKSRNNLQKYFFNEVTLNNNTQKISPEEKAFIEKCVSIIEENLINDDFTVEALVRKLGMSHSVAYKKVKVLTGHALNGFVRFIRLRKAAELCINSTDNIVQIASQVGIMDKTHFREQFTKLYGLPPAEFIKKYRKPFANQFKLAKDALDGAGDKR